MTFALDVNPLLYASDELSPFRDKARELVSSIESGDELVYLFWPVAFGYLRIATNPRAFRAALTPATALANIEALISLPNVRTGGEDAQFLARYRQVTASMVIRGDLVSDAHIVALMKQFDVSNVCTHDRDFLKFSGIRIIDPFA